LNLVLLKQVAVLGFDLRAFSTANPIHARAARDELLERLAAGQLHPLVSQTYKLTETAAALRHLADRRAIGKVIIDPTA
jgi:NADPH:quinone reductase-like Zn-dependent oxidoreductase